MYSLHISIKHAHERFFATWLIEPGSIFEWPPAERPSLFLQQIDMGSLTCAHIFSVRTKGGRAQRNLHKNWLEGQKKLSLTPPLYKQMDIYGIFNMRTHFGCVLYKSTQELTQREGKIGYSPCPRQGFEPGILGFSKHWVMSHCASCGWEVVTPDSGLTVVGSNPSFRHSSFLSSISQGGGRVRV